jgi:hypothetical protein
LTKKLFYAIISLNKPTQKIKRGGKNDNFFKKYRLGGVHRHLSPKRSMYYACMDADWGNAKAQETS